MTSGHHCTAPMFLDVDTGIDDALAIAYAVRTGAYLIGVSTVAGNVSIDRATENTRRVLAWLGAESVPVHRGASRPLAVPHHDAAHVHGENGLGGALLHESRAPESSINGVEAILEAADRHDGELVIVALGPLTNVAIALSIRPALARQVRTLVVMGGAFRVAGNVTPHAEFNVFADPDAAEQVLAADWREVLAVGLDVTHKTAVGRPQWEGLERGKHPTSELVRQIVARTFLEREVQGFYLHDPLAVAVALEPSLVDTESLEIDVATDEALRGKTTPTGSGRVKVATSVDVDAFEALVAKRLAIPRRERGLDADRTE